MQDLTKKFQTSLTSRKVQASKNYNYFVKEK